MVGYTSGKAIHIPMECATYNTEGLCLTGPMQLKWMEQLLDHPREFVLLLYSTSTASTNSTTGDGF